MPHKGSLALVIIGAILLISAILGGLYVGIWLCFIGGIVQVIEGIKADPVNALDIAIGIARFFFASLAGWLTFILGAFISSVFFATAE